MTKTFKLKFNSLCCFLDEYWKKIYDTWNSVNGTVYKCVLQTTLWMVSVFIFIIQEKNDGFCIFLMSTRLTKVYQLISIAQCSLFSCCVCVFSVFNHKIITSYSIVNKRQLEESISNCLHTVCCLFQLIFIAHDWKCIAKAKRLMVHDGGCWLCGGWLLNYS